MPTLQIIKHKITNNGTVSQILRNGPHNAIKILLTKQWTEVLFVKLRQFQGFNKMRGALLSKSSTLISLEKFFRRVGPRIFSEVLRKYFRSSSMNPLLLYLISDQVTNIWHFFNHYEMKDKIKRIYLGYKKKFLSKQIFFLYLDILTADNHGIFYGINRGKTFLFNFFFIFKIKNHAILY